MNSMNFVLWKYPVHFLAYGLGSGFIPFAPGTMGSLVGVAIFWFMARLSTLGYAAITLVMAIAGIFICDQTAGDMGKVDPGVIVWDEIVGILVAMFLLPLRWRWILTGFILFRLFDIWKPFPINLVEHKLSGGLGIMLDDILAAFYTLLILHTVRLVLKRSETMLSE
jgi:phosphatidylglycerophosphatase A